MSFLDYFRSKQKPSAALAKERLQVVIAHQRRERSGDATPEYLPRLKQELLEVIRKYAEIDEKDVSVQVERTEDCEILELNITLSNTP